jgi:hypothetical protein
VFTPGLDFANVARGRVLPGNRGRCPLTKCEGQALLLEKFAKERNEAKEEVKMVTVSIGGNDFGFGEVVKACAIAYAKKEECNTNARLKAKFEAAAAKSREEAIEGGLRNVGKAMGNAGFAKGEYTIVVQDSPSPIPEKGAEFRYPANGRRSTPGGCPFGNSDAEWANATALAKINEVVKKAAEKVNAEGKFKVVFMELKEALKGRRLCETGLRLVGEGRPRRPPNWMAPGAVNETEWVNQLRIVTVGTPFYIQESIHPNYWGQLALRNCVRKAYANGAPKGGTCKVEGPGLTAAAGGVPPVRRREPKMELK